jgi:hypothetical protein
MDQETLDWIKINKPAEFLNNKIDIDPGILLQKIKRFIPETSWFTSPKEAETIHGMRHLMRVTTYATYLCDSIYSKNNNLMNSLAVAASLHDIRRKDDKTDSGHASRGANWFKKNILTVCKKYQLNKSELDQDAVYWAIKLHEYPYAEVSQNSKYLKYKNVIDLLKTSDALDRYIQPKLKWWINDRYLVIIPSQSLKSFAYNLVMFSEQEYLNGKNNINSVNSGLTKLKKTYE